MYRNKYKNIFIQTISSDNGANLSTNIQLTTTSYNKRQTVKLKTEIDSIPIIKHNEIIPKPPQQSSTKLISNNDFIQKKIIKGKLIKLINNSSLEYDADQEVTHNNH